MGIVWLALTTAAMLALAAWQAHDRTSARKPRSATEARVTLIDGALAAAILVGFVLNAAARLWWADPAAA
jgi:hypothetical protein